MNDIRGLQISLDFFAQKTMGFDISTYRDI